MWKKLLQKVVSYIGNIQWRLTDEITAEDKAQIKQMLGPHYYVILTRRKNHLSTYFICLGDLIFRGKWGHYSHSLMNLENEVASDTDFRLIEAIGVGTKFSPFDEVFNVNSVALLKPRCMSADKWTVVLEKALTKIGTPYDTLFDLKTETKMSCVELVRSALMAEPNYHRDFARFEYMIKNSCNLTPQMFYDCPDFEVVWEVRR